MLYILGGASRSGKTLLARRAVAEKQVPYTPLDSLFRALVDGAPQFGLGYDDPVIERSGKMWPITKCFFNFFLQEERDFLIEGDSLLPSQIKELVDGGNDIRCCFMGYTELTKEEKLALVRLHQQGEVDWTKEMSDEKLLAMIERMINYSKYLKEECEKYCIEYFDISHDFEGVRESAYQYLFAE